MKTHLADRSGNPSCRVTTSGRRQYPLTTNRSEVTCKRCLKAPIIPYSEKNKVTNGHETHEQCRRPLVNQLNNPSNCAECGLPLNWSEKYHSHGEACPRCEAFWPNTLPNCPNCGLNEE